ALMDQLAQGGGVQLADLSEIHWEQDQGFTLVTARQGIAVHLGSEDLEGKLARLASIFRELNGVTAIDCDFSDKIIVSKG
ncbi:MAG TPA: cell division protein FtsQ/DivIB, partial [Geobacterales bacterium]|nr:cell division protein FtsQ/DivIB [Geobacterales bacterium]